MKTIAIFLLFISSVFPQSNQLVNDDWGKYFTARELTGSFVLYDLNKDIYTRCNPSMSAERFLPASTFKIPNTLIGLETGIIEDENYLLKWDGKIRDIKTWNKDHTLSSAFTNSVVWYYQAIARRVGEKRMQHFVDTLNYGNKNISGGIDKFWLSGGMQISANEQIELLKKIYLNQLPVSERSIDILKKIMIFEKPGDYALRAKTGMTDIELGMIGWFVGYIEKGNDVYFFALNITAPEGKKNFIEDRIAITKEILKKEGIID